MSTETNEKRWKLTNIPCPNNCMVKDGSGKEIGIGYLYESPDGEGRLFCRTSKCAFAFQDANKIDHWVGGQAPLNIPEPKGLN